MTGLLGGSEATALVCKPHWQSLPAKPLLYWLAMKAMTSPADTTAAAPEVMVAAMVEDTVVVEADSAVSLLKMEVF